MFITLNNEIITNGFVFYIVNIFKSLIRLKLIVKKKKILSLERYLHETELLPKKLTINQIVKNCLDHVIVIKLDKSTIITIDKNFKILGKYNLFVLCKLINYGTLDRNGCYIFTDVINHIRENIQEYMNRYKRLTRPINLRRYKK